MIQPRAEANPREQFFAPTLFRHLGRNSRQPRWDTDILQRVQFGQQVIRLKDETDLGVAQLGQFIIGSLRKIFFFRKPDFTRVG